MTAKHRAGSLMLLGALVMILLAGASVVYRSAQPMTLLVDGHSRTVAPGSRIGDLYDSGYLAPSGAMTTVWGDVIDEDGGGSPRVAVNGAFAQRDQQLHHGDVVTSRPGHDVVEPLVTVAKFVSAGSVVEGTGPVQRLVRAGSPGLARVTQGYYSRKVVSTETIAPALDAVYVRTAATAADKLVALTFDDGPWPSSTEAVLSVLASRGVRATFFMVGKHVNAYPGIAQQVAAQGHLVANHTQAHVNLQNASAGRLRAEISVGAAVVQGLTGSSPTLLRPPGGHSSDLVRQTASSLGMRTVLWNVDTRDWTRPGAEQIVANAVTAPPQRAIILLHDGGGDRSQTVAALPAIIDALAAQGYSFVTVDELLSVE